MDKIDIERRPSRTLMPLLVTLVVIALLAIAIVIYVEGRRAARDPVERPAADTLVRPPTGL